MAELVYREWTQLIIGAAMEVHNQLRSGFLESVYQEAMEIELAARGVPFRAQLPVQVMYKGKKLRKGFCADLLCCGEILIELKAISQTTAADEAQLLNYLRATGFKLGLLINFGDPGRLDWSRIIN